MTFIRTIIIGVLFPSLLFVGYPLASRYIFSISSNGYILLPDSPFRIPVKANAKQYCHKFTYADGAQDDSFTYRGEHEYCGGSFWFAPMLGEKEAKIYFKVVGNNKAEYWVSPFKTMIGPEPDISLLVAARR